MIRRNKVTKIKRRKVEPVEESFTWRGFLFEQLDKKGLAAVYAQKDPDQKGCPIIAIEVVRLKVKEPDEYHDTKWEQYPGQAQWGRRGKTFFPWDEERIEECFEMFAEWDA